MVDFDGAKVSPVDDGALLFGFEDWIWWLLLVVVVVVLGVEDEAQKR